MQFGDEFEITSCANKRRRIFVCLPFLSISAPTSPARVSAMMAYAIDAIERHSLPPDALNELWHHERAGQKHVGQMERNFDAVPGLPIPVQYQSP